jgi:hypothetical protein
MKSMEYSSSKKKFRKGVCYDEAVWSWAGTNDLTLTPRKCTAKGGRASLIVDRRNPERLDGKYVRDERLRAREVTDMLGVLENFGVEGVFVFTFVAPALKYHEEAMYDFDMASFSLVKSYDRGKHGVTYPDMTWEPKGASYAVADFYAGRL